MMKVLALLVLFCLYCIVRCEEEKTKALKGEQTAVEDKKADPSQVHYTYETHYVSQPVVTHTTWSSSSSSSSSHGSHISSHSSHGYGGHGSHISSHSSHGYGGHHHVSVRPAPPPFPGHGLRIGSYFRFKADNYRGRMFRHRGDNLMLDPIGNDDLYIKDSTFKVVKGLAGAGTISLQSLNYPGSYLRHQNFWMKLSPHGNGLFGLFKAQPCTADSLCRKDASFKVHSGLSGHGGVSFEASNVPGYFIRHVMSRCRIDKRDDGSSLYKMDATWFPVASNRGDEKEIEEDEEENDDDVEESEDEKPVEDEDDEQEDDEEDEPAEDEEDEQADDEEDKQAEDEEDESSEENAPEEDDVKEK